MNGIMQNLDINLKVNNNNTTINNNIQVYHTSDTNIINFATTTTNDTLLTINTTLTAAITATDTIYTEAPTNHTQQKFSFSPEYTKRTGNSLITTNENFYQDQNILRDITTRGETAFTILNHDYSPLLLTHKPNAIVYPIRRTNQTTLRRSINDIDRPNDKNNVNHNKNHDYDDLRVTGTHIPIEGNKDGAISIATTHSHKQNVQNFAKELNKRLYRLTNARSYGNLEANRSKHSSQNVSNHSTINQRPLFITTVPRGKFLPPPKEIFLISPRPQKQRIYAYSSYPVVYQTSSHYHNSHNTQQIFTTLYSKEKYCTSNNVTNTTTTTTINTTTPITTTTTTTTVRNTIDTVVAKPPRTLNLTNMTATTTTSNANATDIITTTTTSSTATATAIPKYKNRNYVTAIVKDKHQTNEISSQIAVNDKEMVNRNVFNTHTDETPTHHHLTPHNHNNNKIKVFNDNHFNSINYNLKQQQQQQQQQHHQQQPEQKQQRKQQDNKKHYQRYRLRRREIPPVEPYKNVMYDKRVVRGSNFSTQALLSDYDPFDKAAESRRRLALRKKSTCTRNLRNVLGTPPPVTGRRHEVMQTDKYLEELVVRPIEYSVETQTDLFLEKPPTPPYIPGKVGIDASTEIGDGELFHFEAEAQPIIDVLVDSTIELSILEVAHEQELAALRERQEELLAQREAELAELRRLEAEEIRLQAEKERRLRQDVITKSLDDEMQREITTAKLLQGHIASILPEIIDNLEPAISATKRDTLMKALCPWLSAEVASEVGQIIDSRDILTNIIKEIIKQRAEIYAGYKEEVEPPEILGEEEHEACELETEAELEASPRLRCPPEDTPK